LRGGVWGMSLLMRKGFGAGAVSPPWEIFGFLV